MIRILHSVSNMNRAGIETMLMNYYRCIDRNNIQFDFLCNKKSNGDYDDEIRKLGGKIYYSPGFNPLKIFKYIDFLKKIKNENQDLNIIHSHNAALSTYTLFCAKKAGFNIRIAHSHSTKIPFTKKIKILDFKWIYKCILKKFVVYESTYNISCGVDAGNFLFKNKKYIIINNAIFINKYIYSKKNREKIRKKYSISNNEIVIGHVGRFNNVKNHDFIIKMFNELLKDNEKNYRLLLIGNGELKKKITQKVANMSLIEKVIFVDNCSNVNEYYSAMDIFVLPSKFEGIPVVGIEAQASNLKCIFSDKISKESKITRCVSFCSIDKSDSIKKWIKEIRRYNNYNRNNLESNDFKDYDIKNNAKKLVDIYENLLRNNLVVNLDEKNQENC